MKKKRIYFIGIKGTGLSGLAVIARERGYVVAGSDVADTFGTEKLLTKKGIKIFQGFSEKNLDWNPDIIVQGASWTQDHIEIREARRRKVPLIRQAECFNLLAEGRSMIAVTGVHGKTTTTSLLAFLLQEGGKDPSYLFGAAGSRSLPEAAHFGKGRSFVVEADEYKASQTRLVSKFLDMKPQEVIVTNIELDHTDFFHSLEDVQKSFSRLLHKKSVKKKFVNGDDPNIRKILRGVFGVTTVGTKPDCDIKIADVHEDAKGLNFSYISGKHIIPFRSTLPGTFNAMNIALAVALARTKGVPFPVLQKAVARFSGAKRRFEITKKRDLVLIDDFAHHPTAVQLTLEGARRRFPQSRIICVFQPHLVSRTKYFATQFASAFDSVDEVIVADIFASAREKSGGYHARDLVALLKKKHPKVRYGGDIGAIARILRKRIFTKGTVIVTMGAGDIYKLQKLILSSKS